MQGNVNQFTPPPPPAPFWTGPVSPCVVVQDVRGRDCAGLVSGELFAGAGRGEDRFLGEHDVQGAHAAGEGGSCRGSGVAARVGVHHQVI